MHRVQLTALTSLKYAGQRLSPGETFSASRQDAKALRFLKKAKDADETPVQASEPPADPPVVPPAEEPPAAQSEPEPPSVIESEAPPQDASYETTALEAEPEAAAPVASAEEQAKAGRRTYRTRTMTPKR